MIILQKGDKPDEEQRMVYAEVYAPGVPDAQGDFMDAEAVRLAAHSFVRKGMMAQVDIQHDNKTIPGIQVVESFLARADDKLFIPGSWVVGVHIPDDDTWEKVKKGELNGFSLEALAATEQVEVEIEIPPVVSGVTSKEKDHVHKFYVAYDETGKFLGGQTDSVSGHVHTIRAGTITDTVDDHNHKFSAVDLVKIV